MVIHKDHTLYIRTLSRLGRGHMYGNFFDKFNCRGVVNDSINSPRKKQDYIKVYY